MCAIAAKQPFRSTMTHDFGAVRLTERRVSTACLLIDRATGGPRGYRRNVPFGQ
jgi:hypothetical protein